MPLSGSPKQIVHEEMHRFKHGELHSGSARGPKVKNRAQAIAIALSEARKHRDMGGPAVNPAAMNMLRARTPMTSPMSAPQAGLGAVNPMRAPSLGASPQMMQMPMHAGGLAHRAVGGLSPAPWYVRQESRNLTHTGPIMSAVPGRTDRHEMSVPANSYVLPADHVSSLGQGNTQAGMSILNHMFAPYGLQMPKMGRGAGPPKPSRPMAISDRGGARGIHSAGVVPIVAAGGEYVVPPHVVAAIGGGNPKHGHAILDKWVIENRKNHVKTLKKLPGPAKS